MSIPAKTFLFFFTERGIFFLLPVIILIRQGMVFYLMGLEERLETVRRRLAHSAEVALFTLAALGAGVTLYGALSPGSSTRATYESFARRNIQLCQEQMPPGETLWGLTQKALAHVPPRLTILGDVHRSPFNFASRYPQLVAEYNHVDPTRMQAGRVYWLPTPRYGIDDPVKPGCVPGDAPFHAQNE